VLLAVEVAAARMSGKAEPAASSCRSMLAGYGAAHSVSY
jgi:hypothetical protein